MKIEEVNKDIEKIIKSDRFYEYDLKDEMFKKYEKIYKGKGPNYPKDGTDIEKKNWLESKVFDKYVSKIESAKKVIDKLNLEANVSDETDFPYLKKYMLFRYQASKNKNRFDCDISYLVYLFYKNRFDNMISINSTYYTPQYFDTYFSVQSLWGPLIQNLCNSGILGKKYKNKGYSLRSDFKWQLQHFKEITSIPELKELFKAFDSLAHYYHTIGNIAPCAPGINSPKGLASNCYDRLDLFFKSEVNNSWLKWYFDDNQELKNIKFSSIVKELHLEKFLLPELDEVTIPKDKYDKTAIENLTNYINKIVELIKDRSNELKN